MLTHKVLSLTLILVLSGLLASSCGLWSKETKMTMGELPAPVRTAVQKVTAGSTITEIEKNESGGKATYEVEYRKDGKEYETHFAEDGTIVKGAR
jgi:uncharacterized membrane protein YkoI